MNIKFIKKLSIIIATAFIMFGTIWNFTNAQLSTPNGVSDIPADNPYLPKADTHTCDPSDLGCVTHGIIIDDEEKSTLNGLLGVFNLNGERYAGTPKFIAYVKFIVNMGLGLLSFIALIMLIYTFYMMFFTENDAGQKKAIGNLKGIFIALVIMGLSRLIVSFIFWRYKENWQNSTQLTKNIHTNIEITATTITNQNNFYLYV